MDSLIAKLAESWPILAVVLTAFVITIRWYVSRERERDERDAAERAACVARVAILETQLLNAYSTHFAESTKALVMVGEASKQSATAFDRLASLIYTHKDDGR